MHDKLKAQLDNLVKQNVIVPIEEPTPWVYSLVTVEKTVKKTVLFFVYALVPRDLNRAILHEHYPIETVEDAAANFL